MGHSVTSPVVSVKQHLSSVSPSVVLRIVEDERVNVASEIIYIKKLLT